MAASIIEGIDNQVLFVLGVFVALVAICLVHLVYSSNTSFNLYLNSRQNIPDTASDSVRSSLSEEQAQETFTDRQAATLTGSEPLRNGTDAATGHFNNTSIPDTDGTTDGVRWRGNESSPAGSDSQRTSASPGDCISIRVKFMENERTFSVQKTTKVGDLKRLCFQNELNSGQRVRLIYSGRLLQDDTASISFYGVDKNSVVHAQISDMRRDQNEQRTTHHQEADLDLSKLFLPILAIMLTLFWYGFFYYRHLFSAASVIILVFMTFAFGILAHAITS